MFVDQIKAQRISKSYYRFEAKNANNVRVNYIFKPDKLKEKIFNSLIEQNKGGFSLTEYGEVLASWEGEEPNPIIKMLMKIKFDLDFDLDI